MTQYLRGEGIPALGWLDDFWLTNEIATQHESLVDQARAVNSAICLELIMLYKCGYFMSFSKCSYAPSTRLVYLGLICCSQARRFEVTADKLDKLRTLLRHVIHHSWISFVNLEKLADEGTSISVAVPPASLYTHHMDSQIVCFRRTGGSLILARVDVPHNGGLRYEMEQWLAVRERLNEVSWYHPAHHSIAITGAIDASSQAHGEVSFGALRYSRKYSARLQTFYTAQNTKILHKSKSVECPVVLSHYSVGIECRFCLHSHPKCSAFWGIEVNSTEPIRALCMVRNA